MKRCSISKKVCSVVLALLMAFTALTPAFAAFAGDVIMEWEIQLFYEDGTMVPPTDETTGERYIQYMTEGEELQLSYKLIDCDMPDNGYVKWYSETPTLVDVNQDGLVKAFDASKGAVIQSWIDNEVKSIPLVGSAMGTVLEKLLFETVDVDTMDTDEIIKVVEDAFGSDSLLAKWFESYEGQLVDSLRKYLDSINSNIHATLYDANGEPLADAYVQVCVQKNEEVYATFLPNGTHITNKSNIETTVAKGTTCQLYAVTTPVRLHMGVVYSVKSSSIFTQGNVVATVDDSGLVTFKNTGTVTIVVSPDTEGFINNLLKYVNWIYETGATGTLDTKQIADILIKYVGIDMDRNVLAALLDAIFVIKDIAGDTANPVQITATAVQIVSNIILKFIYNDSITFNVVEGVPCTDFNISGATSVQEGAQIQLSIVDAKPTAADVSDITWSSSDESIAYVDPKTGVITGRDAGGSLGSLSEQSVVITATSAANNVQKSVTISVKGKTGANNISDAVIVGETYCEIGQEQDLAYTIYPQRTQNSKYLSVTWGLQTGTDEEGNPQYVWAGDAYDETVVDEETGEETVVHHDGTVTDGIAVIDKNGHYTAAAGGVAQVVMKAVTGYKILNDTFYTISEVTAQLDIFNGLPVSAIHLTPGEVVKGMGSAELTVDTAEINGESVYFATVKKPVGMAYDASGITVLANVQPEDATNKKVKWYIDNTKEFELKNESADTNSVQVVAKAAATTTASVHIWCVSEDGDVQSDVLTLCVTRNHATSNVINGDIEVTNGSTAEATHSMTFDGSWTSDTYACYDCNWYSSNEEVFTVQNKGNSNSDAVLTGVDVGTATLYCVSIDGGIVDTAQVTVYPDKEYLQEVVTICENAAIKRTDENKALYKDFSRKLDYAYYVLYDDPMASQSTCDTYARELLYAFYKLGGYIGLNEVAIVDKEGKDTGDYLGVTVDTTLYKNTSVDLDMQMSPKAAMYRTISWSSSSDSVSVDKNGVCTPTSNDPCWAVITVTAQDYLGAVHTDSVTVAFAKTSATGVTLDKTEYVGGKVGETLQLNATVAPTGTLGVGKASVTDVVWSSSDETVATVDQNGLVTFRYGGDCEITVTTRDGGHTATCAVNVVTNYDALQGQLDTYKNLNLTQSNYYPNTWAAYQQAIADAEKLIEANSSTQKEVDAMLESLIAAYNGLEKYNRINTIEIYLDGEAASDFYQYDLGLLSEGMSYKNAKLDLNVRLYPNNASYESVQWSSSTDKITISEDGVASPSASSSIIAIKNEGYYGQITCTVTDHFGETWTDSVWVSFAYTPVTGIGISESSIAGAIGDTFQLTAAVEPAGTLGLGKASIQDIYWESLNEDIATVDQNGLVTFVSTGATTVRVVSYDGGYSAECSVSTGGDRNTLRAALDQYKDTDYRDYEYAYGSVFKQAYEEALLVFDDVTKTQPEIDAAAEALLAAGAALAGHELIKTESIDVSWVGYAKTPLSGYKEKTSGVVSKDTDALTIDLNQNDYANSLHYNNYVELTAAAAPAGADCASVSWTVDSSTAMKGTPDGAKLKLEPTKTTDNSWAVVTVTVTDSYGRTTERTITVVLSTGVVTGVTLDQTEMTLLTTAEPAQLTANVATSGSKPFTDVTWTSSDPQVATVDANGLVTPVDIGTADITVTTFDGGYTAVCQVTVQADYSVLEAKLLEYNTLISEVEDEYVYTEDSLAVLQETVAQAQTMIQNYRSTQAEIDAQVEAMDAAYNGLVRYIIAEGVSITTDTEVQNNVTIENEGYIRYTNSSLNGRTIQLQAQTQPEGGLYTNIEWSSSNDKIKVDENGLCTNSSISPEYAVITCKITTVKGTTFTNSVYVSFARYGVKAVSFDSEMVHGSPQTTVTVTPKLESDAMLASLVISDCTFSSSDENVATVDANGVVTFNRQGTATITATSCDGGYTGTITAYTTWDFSALQAAIAAASGLEYTDYTYDYGMAFKTAYEAAVEVNKDYTASQAAIDEACANLTEAMSNLEGHEFVLPGEITITSGSETVTDGKALVVDESGQVVLTAAYNQDAMLKSAVWTAADCVNAEARTDADGNLVLTKTAADASGSVTATITLTDDYDRTYTKTVHVKLVNQKININQIAFVYENAEVESVTYSCGGIYTGKSIQLAIHTYPADADAYTAISWSSDNKNLTVDQTGKVSASGLMMSSSYTANITCTLTLEDGSEVKNTIAVTFKRS